MFKPVVFALLEAEEELVSMLVRVEEVEALSSLSAVSLFRCRAMLLENSQHLRTSDQNC